MEIASSSETGKLGLMHLKRYWSKVSAKIAGNPVDEAGEWQLDKIVLSVAGVGLHPTLKYLYSKQPGFSEFEDWILNNTSGFSDENVIKFNSCLADDYLPAVTKRDFSVFSEQDWECWDKNGYFIIRQAVPVSDCSETVSAIEEFLSIKVDEPSTWYKEHPARNGIMVEFFKHPVLQRNRQSAKIRAVYEQLWGRKDIWVNTDRVGFNPPETDTFKFPGPTLHWDVSLQISIPFGLQGILYLSDTKANQGAFTLVPGFHNRITNWLSSLAPGTNPRNEDLYSLGPIPIEANAGDFIVWHQALPHGSSPNTSDKPRIVQYINYAPHDEEYRDNWV